MAKTNYDDWNIGSSTNEKFISGGVPFNSKRNSRYIIGSSFLLLIFGLICAYSASYPISMESELSHYSIFLEQFVYVGFGLFLGGVLIYSGQKILELICPVFMLLCLILYTANNFIKAPFLMSETMFCIVVLANTMYLSLFFANREEGISRLRELSLPIAFSMIFFVDVLLQRNFGTALLFILLTIIMFSCGSVGLPGVILLILYCLVPFGCWILSDHNNIKMLLNAFIPGYFSVNGSETVAFSRAAIASGGIFGRGLGNGTFKYGIIQDIQGENIFCNIAEEFGFIGVCILFVLFSIIVYCSLRSAKRQRNSNRFYSNFTIGLCSFITGLFSLNITSVLGILPVSGISLPFVSSSSSISVVIICAALLYKFSKNDDEDVFVQEESSFNSDSDFEVGYDS